MLGTYPCRGKFRAQIRINGEKIHLGTFNDVGTAHRAYLDAKRKYGVIYGRISRHKKV